MKFYQIFCNKNRKMTSVFKCIIKTIDYAHWEDPNPTPANITFEFMQNGECTSRFHVTSWKDITVKKCNEFNLKIYEDMEGEEYGLFFTENSDDGYCGIIVDKYRFVFHNSYNGNSCVNYVQRNKENDEKIQKFVRKFTFRILQNCDYSRIQETS